MTKKTAGAAPEAELDTNGAEASGTSETNANVTTAAATADATRLEANILVAPQSNEAGLPGNSVSTIETVVRVRVLTACSHGQANDVAEVPAHEVAQMEAAGLIDSNADAVAYALSLSNG